MLTKENYLEKRQEIVDANTNLLGVYLHDQEAQLNDKLTKLKQEFKDACGGNIPYDMPVLTDKRITDSRLYKFCSMLPKGADLHVHDLAQLPISELCKILMKRDDIYVNTIGTAHELIDIKTVDAIPEGYMLFRDAVNAKKFTDEDLLYSWTLLGASKEGKSVWEFFEDLFVRHAAISDNPDFALDFYHHTFRYYCEHKIFHTEIHMLLSNKMQVCADTIKTVRQAYYDIKKEYPQLSVKIIGAGMKDDDNNLQISKTSFLNTVYVQETIKDESDPGHISNFVIGFDLINEEDNSLPLSAFAPFLIDAKTQYPDMKFYIHSGESLDAKNDNLIDAYLLGVARVGHGMNLYRYPDLLNRYANSEICLEVCVISNQTLGYTTDVRVHPATEYLRRGVAIALCSDDPTYQEHETLTDDFFAGIVSWDLDIADIKQLAINSLVYSGLDEYEKVKALKALNKAWQEFVKEANDLF